MKLQDKEAKMNELQNLKKKLHEKTSTNLELASRFKGHEKDNASPQRKVAEQTNNWDSHGKIRSWARRHCRKWSLPECATKKCNKQTSHKGKCTQKQTSLQIKSSAGLSIFCPKHRSVHLKMSQRWVQCGGVIFGCAYTEKWMLPIRKMQYGGVWLRSKCNWTKYHLWHCNCYFFWSFNHKYIYLYI